MFLLAYISTALGAGMSTIFKFDVFIFFFSLLFYQMIIMPIAYVIVEVGSAPSTRERLKIVCILGVMAVSEWFYMVGYGFSIFLRAR